jgi:hypothetical protein
MLTRILAAAVAGGAATFLLGFLIYGLLLDSYMKANMVKHEGLMYDTPIWIPLIVANLVWALLIAFIFDYWANISTFVGGLKGGAIIMFLMALNMDLSFMAFMNLWHGVMPVVVDVIAATVMGAIAGGVIGAVLGVMGKQTSAAAA